LIRERVEAELSPTASEVGYSSSSGGGCGSPPGTDDLPAPRTAIRFAMEERPHELLLAAQLKVAEKRFDGIRRLYESVEYPLARAGERVRQPNDLSKLRETPMKVRPHARAVVKRIEAEGQDR
jgi:hypothetical protein